MPDTVGTWKEWGQHVKAEIERLDSEASAHEVASRAEFDRVWTRLEDVQRSVDKVEGALRFLEGKIVAIAAIAGIVAAGIMGWMLK